MARNLPYGWENRRNNLSEHDMKLVRSASTRSPLRARGRVPVRRLLEKAPAASTLPGRSPPLPSLAPPLISAEDPTLSHPRPTPHLAFHHRLAQGAAAAGTFSSKGVIAGAYADGTETHKTTEEVESYWMGVIEKERADAEAAGAERPREGANALPWGFEQRAKIREAEAKAYGAADARAGAASAYGGPTPGSAAAAAAPSPSLAAAFAGDRHAPPPMTAATGAGAMSSSGSRSDAETGLVRVATNALETLAAALEAKPVPLEDDDRAKFAAAVKKAMDVVVRCRH